MRFRALLLLLLVCLVGPWQRTARAAPAAEPEAPNPSGSAPAPSPSGSTPAAGPSSSAPAPGPSSSASAPNPSGSAPAAPNASPNAPAPSPQATAEARRHFKLGIKLYQDTNYPGALAEFEAAYAAKPSPSSLQNVALCQKALFRYREAAITLEQLLQSHGSELSEGETKAVTEAITELHGLVGSIVVNVEPSDAKVSIDGRP